MPRDIPAFSTPDRNRRVILQTRPTGVPQPKHFTLDEVARPECGPGKILVRNVYLSVEVQMHQRAGRIVAIQF